MDEEQLSAYQSLPPSESFRRLDFDTVEILTLESDPPQYLLAVSGTKPTFNLQVDLFPLVYIRQPEYWGIEVVGRLPGEIALPAQAPYTVTRSLTGIIGTVGIEVIGATRTERRNVPPAEAEVGTCFTWSAVHDRQPPGATLHVRGTCRFPTTGFTVELRRHEPQGINPRDLLLDRIVYEPDIGGDAITDVEVRYDEETTLEYDTVTILADGPSIPVQVVF